MLPNPERGRLFVAGSAARPAQRFPSGPGLWLSPRQRQKALKAGAADFTRHADTESIETEAGV